MERSKLQKMMIGASIIIIAVIFVVYKKPWVSNSTNQTSTTTPNVTILKDENGNEYTLEEVPVEQVSIPDLNRKAVFGNDISLDESTKKLITEKINVLQIELKQDSKNLSNWLNLGLYQKIAGDYEGARLSWEYVSQVSPSDYISVGNLANLYGYYLKDNAKAESYYKLAVQRGPTQESVYLQFAEFYADVLKDKPKAIGVLNEGLKKLPNNQILIQFKNSLN